MGIPAILSHSEQIQECCEHMKQKYEDELKTRQLEEGYKSFLSEEILEHSDGAARMDKIRELISNIPGYTLSYFQRMALDEILRCIAPSVFAGCDEDELAVYMEKHRWEPVNHKMFFMQTSRRSGKTDLLTIVAAALLIAIPNVQLICWSLFNETSALFGKTVKRWLVDMGEQDTDILHNDKRILLKRSGERELTLIGAQNPNVSFLFIIIIIIIINFFSQNKNI